MRRHGAGAKWELELKVGTAAAGELGVGAVGLGQLLGDELAVGERSVGASKWQKEM